MIERDIDNFFDSLDHERLIRQFSDLVSGEPILTELVALWCRMGLVDKNGQWRDVQAGFRQGHVLSPFLANLYLHPLDEFAIDVEIGWIRYADNYLILSESRDEACFADERVSSFLRDHLSLRLNRSEKVVVHVDDGFSFLGIRFRGAERTIEATKIEKMKRKISWLLSPQNLSAPEKTISDLDEMIRGWQRHYGFLNPSEQFSQIDAWIEKEFSALVAARIKEERWPSTPPVGLLFPIPTRPSAEGQKKIEGLWKQASSHQVIDPGTILKSAEAKVAKRRRQHRREQVPGGNLVVTAPGHFVGRRGERIVVRNRQKIVAEVPVLRLQGLSLNGRGVAISSDVVELCTRNGLYVHFVDDHGRIFAVLSPPGGRSGEISLIQITERSKERGLLLAKMFVLGKVKNQLSLLKSFYKYGPNRLNEFGRTFSAQRRYFEEIIEKIEKLNCQTEPEAHRRTPMGLEGAFGAAYWKSIGLLLRKTVAFERREGQGARDPVNSALNYGYGILYGRCLNAIVQTGLNPMTAFLHSDQGGKPVLVYDLIEEFRTPVVNRPVFAMFNRRERLSFEEDGKLTPESRKKIAKCVLRSLSREVEFDGRKQAMDSIIKEQAARIKKHLIGKARYRPFLARW